MNVSPRSPQHSDSESPSRVVGTLACPALWQSTPNALSRHAAENDFHPRFELSKFGLDRRTGETCYTARRIRLFASSGPDFQEGPTDLPVRRIELALPTAQCRGRRVKNIFVGNLSFNTNEDELRQMFEAYGQVDRVSIMTDRDTGRSRGFGFVEMANNEDGEKAIAALNGSQIGGRTLNVNEARPKVERAGGGGRGDRGGRGGGGGRRDRW
jgi:cold-inducible RNA-binding protein